jgi:transcriptional regulator with PAS, ATPase and Fis domain
MLEAEIFGHLKGSFTHSVADKQGLFEVAHLGTIFLDEVGEMSPDLQSKLLRFLETGALRRVGATQDTIVDTRVVAATNRPREAMQKGEGFRSDLYYRLAHAVYVLPPLRERGDDVEMLVEHFLAFSNRDTGKRVTLSRAARERLHANSWPGNVRQLRSVLQKMVVSAGADEVLTPRHVPIEEMGDAPETLDAEMEAQERTRIEKALRDTNGVTAAAAKLLRLKRTTLVGRMKRLGIRP